jgi:hypothetical protein
MYWNVISGTNPDDEESFHLHFGPDVTYDEDENPAPARELYDIDLIAFSHGKPLVSYCSLTRDQAAILRDNLNKFLDL